MTIRSDSFPLSLSRSTHTSRWDPPSFPTGQTSRPPLASCSSRLEGIDVAAAPTWMQSYGELSKCPRLPSPSTKTSSPESRRVLAPGSLLQFSSPARCRLGMCSRPTAIPPSPRTMCAITAVR